MKAFTDPLYLYGMKRLLLPLMLLALPIVGRAQESEPHRPKVGLVLSGGGAKGLAHIGALKVLEEAGVKVDYIGGTSMGAIVGALYAAGYSAKQLDSIFRDADFTQLIQDKLPRSAKTFYEKEDSERYALTLPFRKFKISFPKALSGGQNIYNVLVKVLYPVRDVNDFSKLPTPFFCMATDVETGNQVLLDHGYLPEAIMASGAFPSLFEPTEIDGKVLIDGGVVNNYPVDEMRARGADIVIGVDVQHGLNKRDALTSATGILLQINNYRTANAMAEKAQKTDVYIQPDIGEYSVIDFGYAKEIIDSGEEAAKKQLEALREVAREEQVVPEPRSRIVLPDSLDIGTMELFGNENYTRGYVKGKLRLDLAEKTTFDKLEQGINNLAATGNFQAIRYELYSGEKGDDLHLKLNETRIKTFIRLGVHFDDLMKSAALINLTKKNFLMDDDVASFDFILGDNIRYNLQYYVDKGLYWSFGINSKFTSFDHEIDYDLLESNFEAPTDNNIGKINMDVTDLTNQIYIQTLLRDEFSFTLGAEHRFLKFGTATLDNEQMLGAEQGFRASGNNILFEKSHYFGGFGRLTFDTYDDKYFPTRGLFFDSEFHFYGFSSNFYPDFKEFSIAKGRLGGAFPIVGDLSMHLESEAGFKLGVSGVSTMDFILGGYGSQGLSNQVPFVGYDFFSLPGNSFIKGTAVLDYGIAPKNHILFMANYANVADDLFRTGDWFDTPDYSGYGVGYGWESFIGPVQVLYSWSPQESRSNLFFSIGYWF